MAMVRISNGVVESFVSIGAYNSQFKKLGFEIIGNNTNTYNNILEKDIIDDEFVNENTENVDEFEELIEKPISQWTNEELKMFVTAKGIDTSSARKTSEVRNIVKNYFEQEAKRNSEM